MYQMVLYLQSFQKMLRHKNINQQRINIIKNTFLQSSWKYKLQKQLKIFGETILTAQQINQIILGFERLKQKYTQDQAKFKFKNIQYPLLNKQQLVKLKDVIDLNQSKILTMTMSKLKFQNESKLMSLKINNKKATIYHKFRALPQITLSELKKLLKIDYSDIQSFLCFDKKMNRYSQNIKLQDIFQNEQLGELDLILKKQMFQLEQKQIKYEDIKIQCELFIQKKNLKSAISQINRIYYYLRDNYKLKQENQQKFQQWKALINNFQKIYGNTLFVAKIKEEFLNNKDIDSSHLIDKQKIDFIEFYNNKFKSLLYAQGKSPKLFKRFLQTKLNKNILKGQIPQLNGNRKALLQLIKPRDGILLLKKNSQQSQKQLQLFQKSLSQKIQQQFIKYQNQTNKKKFIQLFLQFKQNLSKQQQSNKTEFYSYHYFYNLSTHQIEFNPIDLQFSNQVIERISKIIKQFVLKNQKQIQRLIFQFYRDFGTQFNAALYTFGGIFSLNFKVNKIKKSIQSYRNLIKKFIDLFMRSRSIFSENSVLNKKSYSTSQQLLLAFNDLIQYNIQLKILKSGQTNTESICDWKNLIMKNPDNWIILNSQQKIVPISTLITNHNNLIQFTRRGINKADIIKFKDLMLKTQKSIKTIGFQMFEYMSEQIFVITSIAKLGLNKYIFHINNLNNIQYYNGTLIDGKKQGFGIQQYYNGDKYLGKWKNQLWEGQGTYTFVGGYYSGNFIKGKRQGKGKMVFENGNVYLGSWKNDKFHGFGQLQRVDGSYIEGQFSDGQPLEGKGLTYIFNGDQFDGTFINGAYNGYGQYTWRNNSIYKGLFLENNLQGRGKLSTFEGVQVESTFKNNKPLGKSKIWIPHQGQQIIFNVNLKQSQTMLENVQYKIIFQNKKLLNDFQ